MTGIGGTTRQSQAELKPSATLAAKLLSGRIAGTTLLAQERETAAAFAAEFHLEAFL